MRADRIPSLDRLLAMLDRGPIAGAQIRQRFPSVGAADRALAKAHASGLIRRVDGFWEIAGAATCG